MKNPRHRQAKLRERHQILNRFASFTISLQCLSRSKEFMFYFSLNKRFGFQVIEAKCRKGVAASNPPFTINYGCNMLAPISLQLSLPEST